MSYSLILTTDVDGKPLVRYRDGSSQHWCNYYPDVNNIDDLKNLFIEFCVELKQFKADLIAADAKKKRARKRKK